MEFSLGANLHPAALAMARALEALGEDAGIAVADVLTAEVPDPGGHLELSFRDGPRRSLSYRMSSDDSRVLLSSWGGPELEITAIAPSMAAAEELLAQVLAMVQPLEQRDEAVLVTFWAWNERMGATARRRPLEAGVWSEMASNYPAAAQAELERLMGWESAPDLGQLLLLYGPPGTGKTHAIRALAQAWRSWCDVSYVVDPERFFGSADYMLSVLLDGHDEPEPEGEGEQPAAPRWQLVVVEDTDELIRQDAKTRSGQAMSRLLNLCDGLIGQGLRVLVLLTTNEPLDVLHPAVTRPGRCAARIEVGLFPPDEAHAWLSERGVRTFPNAPRPEARPPSGPVSLADLYQRLHRRSLTASARPIGFASR